MSATHRIERTTDSAPHAPTCWVCGSGALRLVKTGNLPKDLSAAAFQITDSDYGRTGDIFRCEACGFLECPTVPDVVSYYEDMDDAEYEATRAERALQARRLLQRVAAVKPAGRLLDVGAGSGILVKEARDLGYDAEGIEPSKSLTARAAALGLPVHGGVLPSPDVTGPYDVVTLVDVIEHVTHPVTLLGQIGSVLSDDGVCLIVTPDVRSFAARLMGWKWWHYRIAHIGYFDRATLSRAASAAGMEVVQTWRPSWYFPASYLAARVLSYLPRQLRPPVPQVLDRVTVPLNLFDSLVAVCRKRL